LQDRYILIKLKNKTKGVAVLANSHALFFTNKPHHMQRRKFLVSSGVIASAMIASPSTVWSADNKNKIAVLLIRDTAADNNSMINSVIKDSSALAIQELAEEQISDLVYSSGGFSVTTNDGRKWLADKIIFSSYKKMDVSHSSVNVKTENQHVQLRYDAVNKNTPSPEFWALTARKFDNGKITTFLKRRKHAFLCIS
jgi:hypothetical protein